MPSSTAAHPDHLGGLPPRSSILKPKRRIRAASSSDSVQTSSSSSSGNSQFQMMHISISILVLEGLNMESNTSKDQLKVNLSNSRDSIGPPSVIGNVPVNAVISCFKNIAGNRAIATHVPSLPLGIPKESLGKKNHQFIVRWPVDYDPCGDALSTFRCNRLMKKEYPTQCQHDQFDTFAYGYDAEEIELNICLMRGSEMITLGAANLVVTGEEVKEITVDLPIDVTKGAAKRDRKVRSPSPLRRTGTKLFGSAKPSTKVMKSKSFPGDSRRKYKLSEHSMVRLNVKVNPATRPSSSFDEFGPEPNENIYHNSIYRHPNVQETRPSYRHPNAQELRSSSKTDVQEMRPSYRHLNVQEMRSNSTADVQEIRPSYRHPNIQEMRSDSTAAPLNRKYEKRNLNMRARSSPRLAKPQASFNRPVPSRSSSVVKTRDSLHNNEVEHHQVPNPTFAPIGNSRHTIRRYPSIGDFTERRERRGNGHVSQEYQRQDFHAKSKIPASERRKGFHRSTMGIRNEPTQKMEQKCTKSFIETILSHGASFINSATDEKKLQSSRRSYSSKSTFTRKSSFEGSSSSSASEYESESDDSSFESSRQSRGRSPHRRR